MAQKLRKKWIAVLLTLSLMAIGIRMYSDCAVSTVMASEIGQVESATMLEDLRTEGDGALPEESSDEESGENSGEETGESMAEQTAEAENEEDNCSDTGSDKETEGQEAISENKTEQAEYITDKEPQGESTVSGNDAGTVSGETEEAIHQPKILLRSCNLSGAELSTGSKNWLESVFRNMSESETIYNLKVTVGAGNSFIQFSPGSFYFSTVNPGEEIRLEGELKIDVNAESGTVPIYFDFEYEDENGNAINGKESISVSVAQQPIVHQPKLLVESCNLSGKDLGAGSQEKMTVTFRNYSDSQTIYNLKVTASAGSSMQLIPGSFHFAQVAPGEVICIEGDLKVALKAESGMMPFGFELEYEDEKGTAITGKEGVVLSIAEQPITRNPQILLESCNLSGKELEAGSQEQMTVSFKNCSKSQAMYNVKVTVSADVSYVQFLPASFYFEKIGAGDKIELQSEVAITADAESGVIPLTFDFDYEDREGVGETGQERTNLSVVQPIKMELDAAGIPSFVYASETQEFSVKAFNLSRAGVYNVRISLSGTGLFPVEDVFIGNMEAGTEGAGTMRIYVGTRTMTEIGTDTGKSDEEKYGEVDGIITLKYEDEKGKNYEIEQDFHTEIKKAQILSLNVNEEVETNFWQISVFVIIIIGLTILAVSLWLRLRKKNVLLEEARQIKDES